MTLINEIPLPNPPHCLSSCSRTAAAAWRSSARWRCRWRGWRRRSHPCWPPPCPAGTRSSDRWSCARGWREGWWWCPGWCPRTWTACPGQRRPSSIKAAGTDWYWEPAILPSAGNENNVAQPAASKDRSSTSHFSLFNSCLPVILELWITLKIHMLCFVLINSILLNLLCVFWKQALIDTASAAGTGRKKKKAWVVNLHTFGTYIINLDVFTMSAAFVSLKSWFQAAYNNPQLVSSPDVMCWSRAKTPSYYYYKYFSYLKLPFFNTFFPMVLHWPLWEIWVALCG